MAGRGRQIPPASIVPYLSESMVPVRWVIIEHVPVNTVKLLFTVSSTKEPFFNPKDA